MPSWKVHKWIDKLFLGKEFPDVHRFLDEIGTILNKGYIKGHRTKWGHTPEFITLVYILSNGDIDRTLSAWLHQIVDKNINYQESKILEYVLREIFKDSSRSKRRTY